MSIDERFQAAVNIVQKLPKEGFNPFFSKSILTFLVRLRLTNFAKKLVGSHQHQLKSRLTWPEMKP